ncbi:cytochrome P450 [Aspergillus saccharolyticus JOP 1030-1]|uniref:Cytochrome P450 n=1 Tax=Aspergillus saccharolyticus JOP 1030-1 TaxID=1450539 RepID=A0A318Z8U6_9EURO|nr:cytochrome P450 [Aspergillus saccharolyticus JOP 1030-1]PYH43686.1 cytochrome P450 [Aspergillus saccharolyticus JOP 1030-1]
MALNDIQHAVYEHYLPLAFGVVLLAVVANGCYELLFNPLRKFPGPKLAVVTYLPSVYHTLRGDHVVWLQSLHRTYGHAVRYSPDELSFTSAQAWRDIYGHASGGRKSTEKYLRFYGPTFNGTPDIIRAKAHDHARFRRNFSHAFSDKALRAQQPLIAQYADMLVTKLQETVQKLPSAKTDMVRLYNLTTFDIMGDLTFGDPLNLLKGTGYLDWVGGIFASVKILCLLRVTRYYAWLTTIMNSVLSRSLKEQAETHFRSSKARVDWRVEQTLDKPDIWGLIMGQKESLQLTRDEMYSNSQLFMVAGTETTATALSGLTYQLLTHPEKMQKITQEIREAFKDEKIDMIRLAQLKYLNACIEEGLRVYPPVPVGAPRQVPEGGMTVCGEFVPANVSVSVHQWATYRSPENFKRPDDFVPERWTDDPEFASDNKAAFQPFSYGPRNCLGKNLAYHEMRIILAKVLYHFTLSLAPESVDWDKQNVFSLWEKKPLMVQLHART